MFLSLGTTIIATSSIIFRIYQVLKGMISHSYRTRFVMVVLAESGAIYAATLLIDCVLLITHGTAFNSSPNRISFWIGVVTPMAVGGSLHIPEFMTISQQFCSQGIAPTLMVLRLSATRATVQTYGEDSIRFTPLHSFGLAPLSTSPSIRSDLA